jgi:hypothetical protein
MNHETGVSDGLWPFRFEAHAHPAALFLMDVPSSCVARCESQNAALTTWEEVDEVEVDSTGTDMTIWTDVLTTSDQMWPIWTDYNGPDNIWQLWVSM